MIPFQINQLWNKRDNVVLFIPQHLKIDFMDKIRTDVKLLTGIRKQIWHGRTWTKDRIDLDGIDDNWSFDYDEEAIWLCDPDLVDMLEKCHYYYYVPDNRLVDEDYFCYIVKEEFLEPTYDSDDLDYGDWDSPVTIETQLFHYPQILMKSEMANLIDQRRTPIP